MNKPTLIPRVIFLLAGLFILTREMTATEVSKSRPPNILVIVVDDLGWADLSCQGSKEIHTPGIDRLARDGVRCSEGYVTAPVCGPSRVSIMTGRYHERVGISANNEAEAGLPLGEKTMGDIMKARGYRTIAIGKWHLGDTMEFHPMHRGFDEFFGFLGGESSYLPLQTKLGQAALDVIYDGLTPVTFKTDVYLTDVFAEQAVQRIRANQDRPWLMYLAFNAPHAPLMSTPAYEARNASITNPKRRTYAGMMTALDDGIGRVLDTLNELNLTENTLVFFLSDNGGPTGVTTSKNDPFRGVKGDVTEGGIRVPFMVMWKNHLAGGVSYPQPVQSLDLIPTMLAVSEPAPATLPHLEGVNLLPFLQGEKKGPPHDTLYFNRHSRMAIRQGAQKLIVSGPADTLGLYDIEDNPTEDPAKKLTAPDAVAFLKSQWDHWWTQVLTDRPASHPYK